MYAVRKAPLWPVVAIPLLVFSTGCANTPKSTTLSVGGAVAGAVVGARVAGPTGAVVGAVVGGVAGYSLGSYLDEADKKRLSAMELKAIESGKSATFVAGKSKAKVTITPEAEKKENLKSYSLATGVVAQPLAMASPMQTTLKYDTPIYRSLNAKQEPRTTLKKGNEIAIPAVVENNTKWGVVVENDTVVGYVLVAGLNKPPAKAAPAKVAAPAAKEAPLIAVSTEKTEPQLVHAVATCKVVVRKVDTGNKMESFTEQVKYCKEPPKGWKNVAV